MSDFLIDPGPVQFEAGIGYFGPQMVQSAADNLTASTTHNQAGAFKVNSQFARFTTVANAGDCAMLPPSYPGMSVCLINSGANNMQVYGAGSDKINGIAGATGVSQMPASTVYYSCTSFGVWTAQDLGSGTNGNYPTSAYQDSLTASTTHTAAGGTPITSSIANFSTVANANDCATLPPALPGMQITVINNGAQTLQVFPATAALGGITGGDTINGGSGGASTTIASPPAITLFFCTKLGAWFTK